MVLETEQDALRQLATMWGQPLPDGEACAQAFRLGLRCHQGKGGLYDLRLLDRPAVVTLRDGASVGYAIITAMDQQNVTLSASGKSHTLPIAALATRLRDEARRPSQRHAAVLHSDATAVERRHLFLNTIADALSVPA